LVFKQVADRVFLLTGFAKFFSAVRLGYNKNHKNSEKYHVSNSMYNRLKTANIFEQRPLFGGKYNWPLSPWVPLR
jgi:hypothetical protein